MPAPELGFEAGSKSYRLKFGFGALCALEDEHDLPFMLIVAKAFPDLTLDDATDPEKMLAASVRVRLSDLRSLFHAGLRTHHPELTLTQVDDLIDEIGSEEASSLLKQVMFQNTGGGESTGNPPRRPRRQKRSTATS
jgi:hypothetical protein